MQSPMRSIFILAILCAAISQCNGFNCNCGKLVVHEDRSTNEAKVIEQENCTHSSTGFMGTDFNGRCFARIDYLSCIDTEGQCAASKKYIIVNFNKVEDGEKELSKIQGKKASLLSYSNGFQFSVITSCTAEMCFEDPSNIVEKEWSFKITTDYIVLQGSLSNMKNMLPLMNSSLPVLQTTRATTSTSVNTAAKPASGKGAGQANVDSQATAECSEDGEMWKIIIAVVVIGSLVVGSISFMVYVLKKLW